MNDATLKWSASPSSNVTGYSVVWTYNGTAQPPQSVPRTAALDASGYTLDFATSNPSIAVQGGDVLGASITAVDATDNLASTAVTPPAVTEPVMAPLPPVNVALVLS